MTVTETDSSASLQARARASAAVAAAERQTKKQRQGQSADVSSRRRRHAKRAESSERREHEDTCVKGRVRDGAHMYKVSLYCNLQPHLPVRMATAREPVATIRVIYSCTQCTVYVSLLYCSL